MKINNSSSKLSILLTLVILISGFSFLTNLFTQKSRAAGVAISATPNEVASATATDITFTWTASAAVEASGTTFTFTVAPALDATIAACTSPDTQADTTSGGTGSFGSLSTTAAIFTTSNATTTTGRSLCLKFPSDTDSGSYSVTIVSSNGDFGSTLVHYVDNNDVTVTATIQPSLSFNIRTLDDSADTNICALGTVGTSTTAPNSDTTDNGNGECGYALAIGTNAGGGFQATIQADAALSRTAVPNYTIANVTNDAAFVAGTEAYGLANVTAAATGHNGSGTFATSITENGNFAADTTPIPTSPTNFVSFTNSVQYTAAGGATDTTRVMHGLAVGSGTPTGTYQQIVTYYVTASF